MRRETPAFVLVALKTRVNALLACCFEDARERAFGKPGYGLTENAGLMPYTKPLRRIPALPAEMSRFVDEGGAPTRAFFAYLKAFAAWPRAVQAALEELEP